jgi:hypothetical protein
MTGSPIYGTADHARMVTFDRHPGVQTAMAWLAFSHLPAPLQGLSRPLYEAACELLRRIPNDSVELTTALNTLVETKDWMVRAGIRSDQGVPGPVPRPAEVVDPPATDWAETARDLTSGDQARIKRHLPDFPTRPIQDRPQA